MTILVRFANRLFSVRLYRKRRKLGFWSFWSDVFRRFPILNPPPIGPRLGTIGAYLMIMQNETTVFFTNASTEQEINAAADALILVACPSVARQSAETVVGRVVAEGKELADLLDAIATGADASDSDSDSDGVWA